MRTFIFLLFIGFAISMSSCREDFEFESSTGDLTFSKDTVYCDTVFTNISSSTYSLKVYNRSSKDIKIPTIRLGKGLNSKYRITVDGMTGENQNNRVFKDVELLAKDSMYIFIEVTAGISAENPTDFLYTDQILFDEGTNQQKVELVTLIQDAYFLYPKRFSDGTTETLTIEGIEKPVYGFVLDENDPINGDEYHWKNDKPYVIYGYAAAIGTPLVIDPGTRIHFHADSGLIIGNGSSLKAKGTLEDKIIFEGDRLEPGFSNVAGQWETIWLTSGSSANEIEHIIIKNAVVGLNIDSNDGNFMPIKNTEIYSSSLIGLYAKTAKIQAENLVINNAGIASLACTLGGSYEFKHCTFNNNWSSSRQVAVLLNNYYKDENGTSQPFPLEQADFKNCIIYGSNTYELSIDPDTSVTFNRSFSKCLIKFGTTSNSLYSFIYENENNIRRNGNPKFLDIQNNKLNIGDDSLARGFGDNIGVPNDILGITRIATGGLYDLGAYQHEIFED